MRLAIVIQVVFSLAATVVAQLFCGITEQAFEANEESIRTNLAEVLSTVGGCDLQESADFCWAINEIRSLEFAETDNCRFLMYLSVGISGASTRSGTVLVAGNARSRSLLRRSFCVNDLIVRRTDVAGGFGNRIKNLLDEELDLRRNRICVGGLESSLPTPDACDIVERAFDATEDEIRAKIDEILTGFRADMPWPYDFVTGDGIKELTLTGCDFFLLVGIKVASDLLSDVYGEVGFIGTFRQGTLRELMVCFDDLQVVRVGGFGPLSDPVKDRIEDLLEEMDHSICVNIPIASILPTLPSLPNLPNLPTLGCGIVERAFGATEDQLIAKINEVLTSFRADLVWPYEFVVVQGIRELTLDGCDFFVLVNVKAASDVLPDRYGEVGFTGTLRARSLLALSVCVSGLQVVRVALGPLSDVVKDLIEGFLRAINNRICVSILQFSSSSDDTSAVDEGDDHARRLEMNGGGYRKKLIG